MRPKLGRWYAYATFGVLGGLLSWFAAMMLFKLIVPGHLQASKVLEFTLIQAGCFGFLVGGMVTLIDGWWDDTWLGALKGNVLAVLFGGLLGALIAVVGHWVGGLLFEKFYDNAGPILGRTLGFGLAGLVGLLDGFRHGSKKRFINGAIGGLIGGLLSGVAYNYLAFTEVPLISRNTLAFAFPIWGAGVMIGVSAANWMSSTAWLSGLNENPTFKYADGFAKYLYSDQNNLIGKGPKCQFRPISDMVRHQHAVIKFREGKWFIGPQDIGAVLTVNDQQVLDEKQIFDGDKLGFGDLVFTFNAR